MADRLLEIAPGFWNIRGSFKVGPLDIGTQASLVRRPDGSFVLLDSYTLTGDVLRQVQDITGGQVAAIINLHPFHTVHVRRAAEQFPGATLHGTSRHVEKAPELPWDDLRSDDPAMNQRFDPDLRFTVPRGVEFISSKPRTHFASVLAFHPPTKTLHVDDTLTYVKAPLVGGLAFHPTLKAVLEERPGAAADFRGWARELIDRCVNVEHLCTAHMKALPPSEGVAHQVRAALAKVDKVLAAHEKRWG